jgi:hypothetical protein
LQTTLSGLEGLKPRAVAEGLAGIPRATLSSRMARQLDCMRGLAELQEMAAQKWANAPEVARIKASVGRFERGLVEIEGSDLNLGKKVLQDLAVKALLEGHADAALKLLPEGGPGEHAAALLRDLKALALGEGKVETWPGKATATEPGQTPMSPRPPPGLEPLIPEAGRNGWKPPVKDRGTGDLPPLQKAETVGATIRTQAEKTVPVEKAALDARAAETRKALTALHERIMAPELADRRRLAAVEAELDRRLKPNERVRVRALLEQKKTPRQIVDELKVKPDDAEDEEKEYLAEVERRLGQALDINQRAQALRLRKQGRTSAEVADILRR